MKTKLNIALVTFACSLLIHANAQSIKCADGEYFWGISSSYGTVMPIKATGSQEYNILDSVQWNLSSPIIVSNKGRLLYSDKPLTIKTDSSVINHNSGRDVVSAGKTLRQAYLYAISKNLKPEGKKPSDDIFSLPSYNTWAALGSKLSESTIEDYADGILRASLKPGCIVIDHGWQNHSGSFEFNSNLFQNPESLISKLHSKGFKVMLGVTPMVSLDCLEFLEFKKSGLLEKNPNGTIKIVEWYGGMSAMLDLSSEKAINYLINQLDNLSSKYKIDGYKFDFIDNSSFVTENEYLKRIIPWTDLVSRYPLNIVHEAYKSRNYSSIVGQLNYQKHDWTSISNTISEAINAGLCGYPFIISDVVGNGFDQDSLSMDKSLIVRQAQLQAFMPSMHFSIPVWETLPKDVAQIIKSAQDLHVELLPYILELASNAAKTGEPIIRSMEYVFSGKGFYDCKDQFMLGSRYLVAPIMSSNNSRTVRLPAGTWVDDSGKKFHGPTVIKVNAALNRILYFKSTKDIKSK